MTPKNARQSHRGHFLLILIEFLLIRYSGAQQPQNPLIGVWGNETTFEGSAGSPVTLSHHGARWSAEVGGMHITFIPAGDTVQFTLPENKGKFQGTISSDSAFIEGYWIQPKRLSEGVETKPAEPSPELSYASPIILHATGRDIWSGSIEPLEDRISLYISINQKTDGSVSGFIRNPEFNIGAGRPFRVERSGAKIHFADNNDSSDHFTMDFDSAGHTLKLQIFNPRKILMLTRRNHGNAPGFYPRKQPFTGYHYRAPDADSDGWHVGSLQEVGMDSAIIESLVCHILDTEPSSPSTAYIHSLLIARHGRLVLEEYFCGFSRDRVHDTRSVAKSFNAALIGAARLRGIPLTPRTRLQDYFPEVRTSAHADHRKSQLELRHLMTMTSGLATDDNDDASPGNEGIMQQQDTQPDWYRYFLDLPVLHDAGTVYAYSSATANMVGGVIERAAKVWLPEFFNRSIAKPLQFKTFYFPLSPTGEGYMGGGMYLRPRDMLKLGQLFLSGGSWNGTQVIRREWTEVATRADSTVNAPAEGYHWHLNTLTAGNHQWREYEANGNGGQLIIVLPELDVVVGFIAGNYNNYGTWSKFRTELTPRYIIPACR